MLEITVEKNRAILNGTITKRLEEDLQARFVWYDIDDLTNPIYFYADGVMYLGLIYDVADAIEELGHEVKVTLPDLGDPPYKWNFIGKYRERQDEAVDALIEARFGVLKAAPGFGKTVCMAAVTAKVGRNTAIIVQAGEPFDQAYNTLRKLTDIPKIGRVSGEVRDPQPVTVYMIQSLAKEIVENPDGEVATHFRNADVVMVDECHHAAADTYLSALNAVEDPMFVLGFSATPEEREDGLQPFVKAYLGTPVFEVTYGEQIAASNLCPVSVYVVNVPPKDYGWSKDRSIPAWKKRQLYQKVYEDYVIYNHWRNMEAITFAKDMIHEGLSVAMIVSRVEHALEVKRLYPEVSVLTSDTRERKEILSKLRSKEIMCVVTTLFDEATDVPSLGAVCMLAGGKTEIRLRQRIRSTRTFSGETAQGHYEKTRGYVWYPVDQADFLKSHSTKCLKVLRSIVKEHPQNEIVWVQ